MNLFIKKLISYCIFTLLGLCLLQYLLILRINKNITDEYDTLEQTSNINAELVFFGSSRCWVHFDPTYFQNQFNLKSINIGVDGHTELSMAYSRLVDYLKKNDNPKYAILSFDPFVRAGSFDYPTNNFTHKNSFARYAFRPFNEDWKTVNHLGFNFLEKYIPLYSIFKYQQLKNCLLLNNESIFNKYGYARHDEAWDTNLFPMDSKMKDKYFNKAEETKVKVALEKIDNFCKTNGIKLICIQTPVFENIYDKEMFLITKGMCKELNIDFIDSNISSIRKDANNFYNSNHLNINGVNKMNKFLSREVLFTNILTENLISNP